MMFADFKKKKPEKKHDRLRTASNTIIKIIVYKTNIVGNRLKALPANKTSGQ